MDELETVITEANFPDTCDPEAWSTAFVAYMVKNGYPSHLDIDPKIFRLWFTGALLTGFSRMFDTPQFDQYISKEYLDKTKTQKVGKTKARTKGSG